MELFIVANSLFSELSMLLEDDLVVIDNVVPLGGRWYVFESLVYGVERADEVVPSPKRVG